MDQTRPEDGAAHQDLDLLYLGAGGNGWGPVDALVRIAARTLGATLTTRVDSGDASMLRKLSAHFPRRRTRGRSLLVIAASPALLAHAATLRHWFPGYDSIAAWVIDSFWVTRISRFARFGGHFDRFFVTDRDLVDAWRAATRTPTSWLPWGTDTLAVRGTADAERPNDLLRLGRQPSAWDDDVVTVSEGGALGLRVAGRPPMGASGEDNQRIVREALVESKFVLAFHNLVSPAAYTHPTRSYVTGRWTDALAAGATVVGAAPANASDVLWDGATLEISSTDRAAGLATIRELVRDWSPEVARRQQEMARMRLDWRWRLSDLVEIMQWGPRPQLAKELAEVEEGGE